MVQRGYYSTISILYGTAYEYKFVSYVLDCELICLYS